MVAFLENICNFKVDDSKKKRKKILDPSFVFLGGDDSLAKHVC